MGLKFDNWKLLISTEDVSRIIQLFYNSLQFIIRNTNKIYSEFIGLSTQNQLTLVSSDRSYLEAIELVSTSLYRRE